MTGKVALLGLVLLTLFIGGSFYFQLTGGPSRTQTTKLAPFGDVTVHLETKPDPPKTGGIPLILHITDKDGKAVTLDKVHYEYSFEIRGARGLEGEKTGEGAYQAVAALSDVGEWKVYVRLIKGTQEAQVEFILRVMANI